MSDTGGDGIPATNLTIVLDDNAAVFERGRARAVDDAYIVEHQRPRLAAARRQSQQHDTGCRAAHTASQEVAHPTDCSVSRLS